MPQRFESFFEFAERIKNRKIPVRAEDYDKETEIEVNTEEPTCNLCGDRLADSGGPNHKCS